MVFKIVGSIFILCASSLLGYIFSRDSSRRPQDLRNVQGLLHMLENEMFFLSSLLADSFEKIAESSKASVSVFFQCAAVHLREKESMNADEAWESAVKENMGKTALNREDQEILIAFGRLLGKSGMEGQVKNIQLTLAQLKLQEKKAEELKLKNEKMYRSLGVLGGLAVIILLI